MSHSALPPTAPAGSPDSPMDFDSHRTSQTIVPLPKTPATALHRPFAMSDALSQDMARNDEWFSSLTLIPPSANLCTLKAKLQAALMWMLLAACATVSLVG